MPLRIDYRCADYEADAGERDAFRTRHWLKLPALLSHGALSRVQAGVSAGRFIEIRHDAVTMASVDLRMEPDSTSELLVLLFNDPHVLDAVGDLSGCRGITRFNGSVYRLLPGTGHQQEWHDDLIQNRLVAISVNLGPQMYDGGTLEIRDRGSRDVVAVVPNTAPGDAVLFRLDPALEHRVTPVTDGVKTAFAGWFRAGVPLGEELRRPGAFSTSDYVTLARQ